METIDSKDQNVISRAAEVLNKGGLIIYPTETAYGVGVDATNSAAVSKLLEYKKRPEGKAISIGCFSKDMAEKYVEVNETAANIYQNFLPGPVTVISKSKGLVDKRLESENNTLGIRIPDAEPILTIIKEFGKPVTTTSANSSGKKTPYSVQDVLDTLSNKQKDLIDLIIDGGKLPQRQTSTVIDTTTEELQTYRQGEIKLETRNPKFKTVISKSVEETIKFGEELMKESTRFLVGKPVVILLDGDLGAGKTHMVKGIAKALGISKTIKSPTYTYVSEYKFEQDSFEGILYHLDAWRIKTLKDIDNLNIKSWVKNNNVIAVEWPKIIQDLGAIKLFNGARIVHLEMVSGSRDTERIFRFYSN